MKQHPGPDQGSQAESQCLHAMCWAAWFRDGVPNDEDEDSAAVQRSWRFRVLDMGVRRIRDGRPTVACR